MHVRETFPGLKANKLRELRNLHWDALKHASTRNGQDRQDDACFAQFEPYDKEHWRFIGWYDYGQTGLPMPVEAQVFQVWYLAKYPAQVDPVADITAQQRIFPRLSELGRARQHARLVEECRQAQKDNRLLSAPSTDPRPLAK
jgi:hypothetical protein